MLIITLVLTHISHAKWSNTGNNSTTGSVGIGTSASSDALLKVGDGNVYFNTSDPDNAGLRFLFDKSTTNNGVDVDLTINTNAGSPIVDWYVRNWGGSYTFNRGSSTGKTKLFEINTFGDIFVTGGRIYGSNSEYLSLGEIDNLIDFYSNNTSRLSISETDYNFKDGNVRINSNDPDNAGLNILFEKGTNNNGSDVNLTIDTNSGSPLVNWYVRNWGGFYSFSRGMNDGAGNTIKKDLFRIYTSGDIIVPDGNAIVDGTVKSNEVIVEVFDVPDYVFAPDYELRSLEDTKKYIQENQHLPEIPSAAELEANGMELGVMNLKLLKKIEELTLHQIELLERLKKLESIEVELNDLKAQLQSLEKNGK